MPDGPPPLPDAGRTAVLRVLAATLLIPFLLFVGQLVPMPLQDKMMMAGMGLVLIIPAVSVILGVIAFARRDNRAGWGYLLGALLAGMLGFGACTLAVFSAL